MVSSSAGAAAAPEELAPRPIGAMPEAPTGNGVIHCIQTVEFSAVGDPQCGHFMDVTAGDTGHNIQSFPCQREARCQAAGFPLADFIAGRRFFDCETIPPPTSLTRSSRG